MFDDRAFAKLYQLLSLDMVEVDCGLKCNQYCCRAAGVRKYFLPGEVDIFESLALPNFEVVDYGLYTGYRSKNTDQCICSREARPFCCRIFPFRPLINEQKVVGLRKAIGFDKDCWVVQPLADWHKNAIHSWQYILSDYDNLCFYARQSIFLKQIKTNPDKSSYSLLYDVVEKVKTMSQEDLWIETEQFFNRLGLVEDII